MICVVADSSVCGMVGQWQASYAAYALSLGLPAIIRAIYLCAFIAAGAAAAMQVYGPVVK